MIVADLVAKLGLKSDKQSFDKGAEFIGKIKTAITAFVGYKVLTQVAGLVEGVVDAGGHLADLSQQIGLSAEAIQELGYASKLAGVDTETLTDSLGKLSKGLIESAQTGKGPVTDAFRDLHLSTAQLKNGTKDLDGTLGIIADAFAKLPDGPKKVAIAMDLFGKSGKQLIPFLNAGSSGIGALRQEARDLGAVMSNESVSALDEFGDNIDKTKATITGLKQEVVIGLLPVLRSLLEGFREWIKNNRQLISGALTATITALVVVFQALSAAVQAVVSVFDFLVEHSELGLAILTILGVVLTVLAAKIAIVGAVLAATWIIAALPLVAFIALVAGLIYVISKIIENWDEIKDAIRGALRSAGLAMRRFLSDVWNGLKRIGSRLVDFFTSDIPNAIKDAFSAAWDWVEERAESGLKSVKKVFKDAADYIRNLFLGDVTDKARELLKEKQAAEQSAPVPGTSEALSSPISAGGASSSTVNNVQGGPVTININGAGDPSAIVAGAEKVFKDNMSALLLQTQEAT